MARFRDYPPTATESGNELGQDLHHVDCLEGMGSIETGSVDLIVADPPYEWTDLRKYFQEMLRVLADHGSIYVFGNKDMVAEHWFSQLRIAHKTLLVWHYTNSPKPRGRWRMSMQAIIYGYKRQRSVFNEDEARVPYLPSTQKLHGRVRPSGGRLGKCEKYDTSKGALPRDVILFPALLGHLSRERVGHPDQKPVGLIEMLIRVSSVPGDLVLDPFAGSGTTLVAATRTGRRSIGFEIERKWILKAQNRLKEARK